MAAALEYLQGYPRFSGNGKKRTAKLMARFNWSDRNTLYTDLWPEPVLGLPQLPALFPGSTDLYAANLEIYPELEDEHVPDSCVTVPEYDIGIADITYSTDPYDNSGDQILTRRKVNSGQFLTYKNSGIRWVGPPIEKIPDPETEAGKLIPSEELIVTLHRVTPAYKSTLDTAIDTLIGKVNNAAFEGYAAESLMFLGGEFDQTVTAGGTQPWQVSLKFAAKRIKNGAQNVGWNFLFSEEHGEWRRIETTNGDKIYPTGNFTTLYS